MQFDDILAGCIEAIEQGATVEECLRRNPTHAASLEPLLRTVVSLTRESKTQMSSQAFARGRAVMAARARQHGMQQKAAARHRRPLAASAPQLPPSQLIRHPHNGMSLRRSPLHVKQAHKGWGIPRFVGIGILLMMIIGATTFIRYTIVSLPGTPFYSVKNMGEQVVGVLMAAAGEEIDWHASQVERRLQEMVRLPQQETATLQTLSRIIEEHWAAVLAATQRLPVAERNVVLQAHLTRLEELAEKWTPSPNAIPSMATTTIRNLITAGEQILVEPAPDIPATATGTATLTMTVTATMTPTNSPTPLLQATPTALQPVLIASATPIPVTTATSAPATPTVISFLLPATQPTATPLPEMTVVIPLQETARDEAGSSTTDSSETDSANRDEDEDHSEEPPTATAEPVVATPMPTLALEEATPSVTPTSDAVLATPTITTDDATVIPTTEPPPVTVEVGTAQATATLEAPLATATKNAPPVPATATPELSVTNVGGAKPTNQAATKTPKPKATRDDDEDNTKTPNATDAATAVPPTSVERTPMPTTQPTVNSSPPPTEATISALATPRSTGTSGEATLVVPP